MPSPCDCQVLSSRWLRRALSVEMARAMARASSSSGALMRRNGGSTIGRSTTASGRLGKFCSTSSTAVSARLSRKSMA